MHKAERKEVKEIVELKNEVKLLRKNLQDYENVSLQIPTAMKNKW